MSSTMDRPPNQLKLHFINQFAIMIRSNEDDEGEWQVAFDFMIRLVVYVIILVVMVIIISLILKYLGNCDGEATVEQVTPTETNRLITKETIPLTYGTCEEDVESGGKCRSSSSSSEDLYDEKICIICYDGQRNCFFTPCGHCATCYVCARRILDGESKTCPVCRRFIHEVRKTFAA